MGVSGCVGHSPLRALNNAPWADVQAYYKAREEKEKKLFKENSVKMREEAAKLIEEKFGVKFSALFAATNKPPKKEETFLTPDGGEYVYKGMGKMPDWFVKLVDAKTVELAATKPLKDAAKEAKQLVRKEYLKPAANGFGNHQQQ